jgi:hypothetical protein
MFAMDSVPDLFYLERKRIRAAYCPFFRTAVREIGGAHLTRRLHIAIGNQAMRLLVAWTNRDRNARRKI